MKKTKIFAILAIATITFFTISSCKKENVTTNNGLNKTTTVDSLKPQAMGAINPSNPSNTFEATTAATVNTYHYTGKNSAGKLFTYSITVTQIGNNLIYDIDGDGIMDYQAIPRLNGKVIDYTNFKIYNNQNNLIRDVNLSLIGKNIQIAETTLSFTTDSPIKYTPNKSLSTWLSCMNNKLDVGVFLSIGVVSKTAAGVYLGYIGVKCCFGSRDKIVTTTWACSSTGTTTNGSVDSYGTIHTSGPIYNINTTQYQ